MKNPMVPNEPNPSTLKKQDYIDQCVLEIREILALGKSVATWKKLCHFLDALSPRKGNDWILSYVLEHVKSWKKELRKPLYSWWKQWKEGEVPFFWALVGEEDIWMVDEGKQAGEMRELPFLEGFLVIWVPASTFQMGSPVKTSYDGGDNHEGPVHQVTLTKGRWVGMWQVGAEEYEYLTENEADVYDESAPIEVTWFDAISFCDALSLQLGLPSLCTNLKKLEKAKIPYTHHLGVRLLTEAEFECMIQDEELQSSLESFHIEADCSEWMYDRWGLYSAEAVVDPSGDPESEERVTRCCLWHDGNPMFSPTARSYDSPEDGECCFRICITAI